MSKVSADGTWTVSHRPGSSLDDERGVSKISNDHLRQLKILGSIYLSVGWREEAGREMSSSENAGRHSQAFWISG